RRAHGRAERLSDQDGLEVVDEVLEENGELAAAETSSRVAVSQRALEALGHRDQDLVAGRVAQAVVDDLEVVEVEEEDGGQASPPLQAAQGQAEPVEEEGPVRQTGEGVVQGLVDELLLGLLALGDVAGADDVAVDRPIPAEAH